MIHIISPQLIIKITAPFHTPQISPQMNLIIPHPIHTLHLQVITVVTVLVTIGFNQTILDQM